MSSGVADARFMEELRPALEAARYAPSAHNSQPWRFTPRGLIVAVSWDSARRLPYGDPIGNYLVTGLGAACEALRLGAVASGLGGTITFAPDASRQHVADVAFSYRESSADDRQLAAQLMHRKTTRLPYTRQPVPPEDVEALQGVAAELGSTLRIISDRNDIDAVARVIGDGTACNFADEAVFAEFTEWLRRKGDDRPDGLTFEALELDGVARSSAAWALQVRNMRLLRRLNLQRLVAQSQIRLARRTTAIGLLTAAGDAQEQVFNAGRAMLRMWLAATARGLRVHPMTAAMDHEASRKPLAARFDVSEAAAMVLCFRLGYAPLGRRSARLPLDDLILSEYED